MEEKKEVIWLIKLFQSEFVKSKFFNSKVACVKDFERLLNAPENDKNFRKWINEMKELSVIEFFKKINNRRNGKPVDGFVVNKENVLKRLRSLETYDNLVKFFDSRAMFGVDK